MKSITEYINENWEDEFNDLKKYGAERGVEVNIKYNYMGGCYCIDYDKKTGLTDKIKEVIDYAKKKYHLSVKDPVEYHTFERIYII